MITVTRLRRKPRHFQSFCGLTPSEFDRLLLALEPVYQQARQCRLHRPDRQRTIGGGRPFALALPERLLMVLFYWRLYVSQGLLSYLFDLDTSNVCREIGRLRCLLLEVLPVPLRDAPLRHLLTERKEQPGSSAEEKPARKRRISTLKELLEAYPDLEEVLIDATEQQVPKPKDKQARKQRYSGKHKEHTVKTQVLTTKTKILHVFGGLPGSLHDMLSFRASGIMRQIPSSVKVRVDSGYQGAEEEYPSVLLVLPVRGRRNHCVTVFGKAYNQMLGRLRVPVEHLLSRTQKFECLSEVWRGRFDDHEDTFCLVAGLVNYKADGNLSLIPA